MKKMLCWLLGAFIASWGLSYNGAQAAPVGTTLNLIATVFTPQNDPAPDTLVCVYADGACGNLKQNDPGYSITWSQYAADNNIIINSDALAKYEDGTGWESGFLLTADFSLTETDGENGTWEQDVVSLSSPLTHYIAVKASTNWVLYEVLINGVVAVGDTIQGTYSSALLGADMSHVSFYNSLPNSQIDPIPLPAALPLLMTALGVFGFFGWRRKRLPVV